MIKILYFARFRESLGRESEELALQQGNQTVTELMHQLAGRDGPWADVFGGGQKVLVAINQEMAKPDASLKDDDEVGFFPPVTGG